MAAPATPAADQPDTSPHPAASPGTGSFVAPAHASHLRLSWAGADADSAQAVPHTRLQSYLLRTFPPQHITNLWFMAALGSLCALAVGLMFTFVVHSVWEGIVSSTLGAAFANSGSTSSSNAMLGNWMTDLLVPDVFKLFALEQHIPLVASAGGGYSNTSFSAQALITPPLTSLLAIPAGALTLGGYISASSDFSRQARYSITRGLLIAPFYAVLLTLLALLSSSSLAMQVLGVSASISVQPSPFHAFLYGLLWGAIFGALGGWIQLTGRKCLVAALDKLSTLPSLRASRIAGAVVGALSAIGYATLLVSILSLAALAFAYTYTGVVPGGGSRTIAPGFGLNNLMPDLFSWAAIAPSAAIYIFAFATGAPLQATVPTTAGMSQTQSLSLLPGSGPNLPAALYLLCLIPIACYFVGGRLSARISRPATVEQGFVAGASMAVALAVLMSALALLVGVGFEVSMVGQSLAIDFGPSVGGIALAVLIVGAIVGGLGGASAVTYPHLVRVWDPLLRALRPLERRAFPRLDRLTTRPADHPLTLARKWLYDAVMLAAMLGFIMVALELGGLALAPFIALTPLTVVDGIAAALLLTIPILFFTIAFVTALTHPGEIAPPIDAMPLSPALVAPRTPGPTIIEAQPSSAALYQDPPSGRGWHIPGLDDHPSWPSAR